MTRTVRLRGSLLATGLATRLALARLVPSGAVAARSQPWERRNAAGLAALEAPRFADAGQRFAVALRQAERRGPDLAESLGRLGALDIILGHFAAAAPRLQAALRIRERAYGPGHREVGQTLYNLGVLHHFHGDPDRAERFYRRAPVVQSRALGPQHPGRADTLDNDADILRVTGRRAEAARTRSQAG